MPRSRLPLADRGSHETRCPPCPRERDCRSATWVSGATRNSPKVRISTGLTIRRRDGHLDGPALPREQKSVLAGVWLTSAPGSDDFYQSRPGRFTRLATLLEVVRCGTLVRARRGCCSNDPGTRCRRCCIPSERHLGQGVRLRSLRQLRREAMPATPRRERVDSTRAAL